MAKKRSHPEQNRVIENRRARHEYAIAETLEVGIQLAGTEVKSVRAGEVSLGEGFITATEAPCALDLHQVNIGEYAPAGPRQHKLTRVRRLLAHKKEIVRLARAAEKKGATIVPLKMYFNNGYAKLLIGLGMGKGSVDKRDSIREREMQRDIDRAMSKKIRF
ncbi:MAG: SsrA-binding protein SmpB [Planctomycetota bacterium]